MIKNLVDIAKAAGIDPKILQAAHENTEEVAVDIPAMIRRTQAAEDERDETIRQNIKPAHYKAAVEIAVGDIKKDKGYDFGSRSLDKLLSHVTDITRTAAVEEAGKEPNTRIDELTTALEDKVKLYNTLELQHNDIVGKHRVEGQNRGLNTSISATFKSIAEEAKKTYKNSDADMLTLFNSKFPRTFSDEGQASFYKDGNVINNDVAKPQGYEVLVADFAKDYLVTESPSGGAGGEDQPGSGAGASGSNYTEFVKAQKAAGNEVGTLAFATAQSQAITDGTLKK